MEMMRISMTTVHGQTQHDSEASGPVAKSTGKCREQNEKRLGLLLSSEQDSSVREKHKDFMCNDKIFPG